MKTYRIPARVEDEERVQQEIREFLRQWVGLLADQKYAEALDSLSPEIPPGSGSVDPRKSPLWTPALLEAVIANYGTPTPVESQPQSYLVARLDSSLRNAFEASVYIDFDRDAIARFSRNETASDGQKQGWLATKLSQLALGRTGGKARKVWLGGAEFALPINFARGNDLSDLSARMRFKPVETDQMGIVLLDIHVL